MPAPADPPLDPPSPPPQRAPADGQATDPAQPAPLRIDLATRSVQLHGAPLALKGRAFDLLALLASRPGEVLPIDLLLQTVWPGRQVDPTNLRVQVQALRKQLGAAAVHGLTGRGYALALPVQLCGLRPPLMVAPPAVPVRPVRSAPLVGGDLLLGRESDLQQLQALLASERLVSLLGPGGIGKTRLALHLVQAATGSVMPPPAPTGEGRHATEARQAGEARPEGRGHGALHGQGQGNGLGHGQGQGHGHGQGQSHGPSHDPAADTTGGTAWADLAQLPPGPRAAGALRQAVAQACGLQLPGLDGPDGPRLLAGALAATAATRPLLLVLDNAEHLAEPLRDLLPLLLGTAAGLRVLVTSQQALRLPQEHAYWLDTLALPPLGADAVAIRASPSVQLLLRRAAAADQRWHLAVDELETAAQIVRALDGIALAIEMAAVRLPLLGARALLARMADGLRLLGQPGDAAPARHRTMLATLDWSHALLGPDEQAALHRLAVFAAPFRFEAAVQVVLDDDADSPFAAEQAIQALVDRSMLQLVPGQAGAPPRLRLLETTRQYAAQALRRRGDAAWRQAELRHGLAMASLAAQACSEFYAASDAAWAAHWLPDHDDFMRAFDLAHARGDATVAGAIIEALVLGSNVTGQLAPALSRWQATRELAAQAPPASRARLLGWGNLPAGAGHTRRGQSEQRVQAWRALPEDEGRQGLCVALAMHATVCEDLGDLAGADAALAECMALEQPDWPPRLRRRCVWIALTQLAVARNDAQLMGRAEAWSEGLILALGQQGAWREVSLIQRQQARMLRQQGRSAEASALLQHTAMLQRQLGCNIDAGQSLGLVCAALVEAADDGPTQPPAARLRSACEAAVQALQLLEAYPTFVHYFIDSLALLASLVDKPQLAAWLLAGGERLRRDREVSSDTLQAVARQRALARLRQRLEPEALQRGLAQGERLTAEALRRLALAELQPGGGHGGRAPGLVRVA